jgi:ferric-dicitrate binding protein FerR (iron transport regulator)
MAEEIRTRLRVTTNGDRVTVTFTRGQAEVSLRFPASDDPQVRMEAGVDLVVLTDNLEQLIDAANLEIEAAILRKEMEKAGE